MGAIASGIAIAAGSALAAELASSFFAENVKGMAASVSNNIGESLILKGTFLSPGTFVQAPPGVLPKQSTTVFGVRGFNNGPVRGCIYYANSRIDALLYFMVDIFGTPHTGILLAPAGSLANKNWVQRGNMIKAAGQVSFRESIQGNAVGLRFAAIPGDIARFEIN